MKKLILVTVVIILSTSLAIAVYFFWPRPETSDVPLVAKEKKKEDPIQHFLPTDWSIASSKLQVLDFIYLPFLHRKFVKKNVRVVQIEGTGLVFYSPKLTYTNSRLTRGTVVVLAETGQLLRVELHGNIPIGPLPGQRTLAEAEDYYQSVGLKYVDLPKKNPQLPFQEVINRVYQKSFAQVEKAARIEAVYVIQERNSHSGAAPTVNWVVHFFDFPPYPSFGSSKSSDTARSFLRFTLDTDGNILSGNSLP